MNSPAESLLNAFSRCQAVQTRRLEEFLDTLIDEDLETLANLPGSPGQVLAAQFTHYAKSSIDLRECHVRQNDQVSSLIQTVQRLPAVGGDSNSLQ